MGRIALPIEHGTLTGYRKGCRCDPCRAKKAESRKPKADPPADDAPEQAEQPPVAPSAHIPGRVEAAVAEDLAAVPADVPMAKSLSAIGLALAREVDQVQTKGEGGSIAGTAGRLLAVLGALRPKDSGGAKPDAGFWGTLDDD